MRKRGNNRSFIDMAPMADIVFLLLIFFMLSSSFVVQPGIKIKLPKAVSSEIDLTKIIVIDVTKEGRIFLNGKNYTLRNLPGVLSEELSRVKEKKVIIKADQNTRHGFVVKIMDIAKLAGAEKLVIATEPTEELF